MRKFACFLVLLLSSCNRPAPQEPQPAAAPVVTATPAAPAEAPAEEECTDKTPLVAGVPGSPGHLLPSDINPNGMSELAALMRTMQDDLRAARAGLEKGQAGPALYPRHRKLRCSWPTEPGFRSGNFDQMAQIYLDQVRSFDATREDRRQAYSAVVGACQACHVQSCPGPLVAIKALQLPGTPGAAGP